MEKRLRQYINWNRKSCNTCMRSHLNHSTLATQHGCSKFDCKVADVCVNFDKWKFHKWYTGKENDETEKRQTL